MDLTMEQKAILKEIASGQYTSGQAIPTDEELSQIIQDAATNAETDLSPYYETLTQRELDDIRTNFANITNAARRYQEQEQVDYKQKLLQTKQNLRSRGMTFSGRSLATLGSESALKNTAGIKGELPTQRELSYSEQEAQWQQQGQQLGTAAERRLGSEALTGLASEYSTPYGTRNIYSPTGNVPTGDIALQRMRAIEEAKWRNISAYKPYI